MLFVVATWAVTALIHVCFALAVFGSANRLPSGRRPIFVGPAIWSLATLFGGVTVAAIYWAMHHSRLNHSVPSDPRLTARP